MAFKPKHHLLTHLLQRTTENKTPHTAAAVATVAAAAAAAATAFTRGKNAPRPSNKSIMFVADIVTRGEGELPKLKS